VNLTGSLWRANFVMYFIAALFFGLAILLRWQYSRKNNNI
jgi:preprotein translocase subunit SecG